MILRRITEHVKTQNWFAVALDFVIVVAGVFIGIQVANWNEARLTDQKAAVFSERLRADLRGEAWSFEFMGGYYRQVLANARRAHDALSGRAPLDDEALLVAAYRATQYQGFVRRRATWEELSSTGELGLIRDPALRQLAMDVYEVPAYDWTVNDGRSSAYRQAFRRTVDLPVQDALAAACGDRIIEEGDFAGIAGTLDYPCDPDLDAEAAAVAAQALRADPDILPLLRLQATNTRTNIANFGYGRNRRLRERLQELAGRPR